jgi:hypothetical protein
MKLQTQAIAGFAIGAIITVGVAMFLMPSKTPFYSAARVDGNTLKTLYNSDFFRLIFDFKYNSNSQGFDLSPSANTVSGATVAVDTRLMTVSTTGKSIAGDRTLVPFRLEHNRVSGLLQLQTLVAIVNANPGCYFMFNPDDYATVDPADHTHICYKIVAYTSAGRPIDVGEINRLVFQLNPSPPGRMY